MCWNEGIPSHEILSLGSRKKGNLNISSRVSYYTIYVSSSLTSSISGCCMPSFCFSLKVIYVCSFEILNFLYGYQFKDYEEQCLTCFPRLLWRCKGWIAITIWWVFSRIVMRDSLANEPNYFIELFMFVQPIGWKNQQKNKNLLGVLSFTQVTE